MKTFANITPQENNKGYITTTRASVHNNTGRTDEEHNFKGYVAPPNCKPPNKNQYKKNHK